MNKFLFLILFFGLQLKAQTVYKTPSGSKYHLASCKMVKNVSSEISLSKASELGLSPCKICNESAPPECREMCGELAIFRTVTDLHDKASGKHYTEVTTVVGCVLQIQTRQTTSLTLIENALRLKKTIETAEELESNEEFSPKESSC